MARQELEEQSAYLASLSKPVESDIRSTIDPTFTIEWRFDASDGSWSYRCFDGDAWFAYGDDVDPHSSEQDRQALMERLVSNIVDNAWPDEWTDPWPLCPDHRDHPLNAEMRKGRFLWVCRRRAGIAIPVGELPAAR